MQSAHVIDPKSVWRTYQRMRVQLAGRLGRELTRTTGLSEADFEILNHLADLEHESVRAVALRCGLEWEKSRLSHQLRRMEQRRLITREACDEDQRGTDIRITARGRDAIRQARTRYDALVQQYFTSALTAAQLATLDEIARAVLVRLDAADDRHPNH